MQLANSPGVASILKNTFVYISVLKLSYGTNGDKRDLMRNGVYAAFSTLLRQALGSVYEGTMPFLRKTVDLGCKAVDAGAGGRGMDAFKRLAGDFGEFCRHLEKYSHIFLHSETNT